MAVGAAALAVVAGTRDLLFLIPDEWWAPVWMPLLASCGFVVAAAVILVRTRRA